MARPPEHAHRPSRYAAPGLLLAALCAVTGLLLVALWAAGARRDLQHPRLGPAPGPIQRPLPAHPPREGAEADFARAFAWAARLEAGATLAAVPEGLRPWLPAARELLAAQPLRRSDPPVDGSERRMDGTASTATSGRPGLGLPRSSAGRAPVGGQPSAGLGRPPAPGVVIDHGDRLAIAEPGIYLDRRMDPSVLGEDGFGLELPPGAPYAIRLDTADPGGLRLDGGLVVPGRWYQVRDGSRIRVGAMSQLHLRPISALDSYHPQPAAIPRPAGDS